jgi:hypothetical protein
MDRKKIKTIAKFMGMKDHPNQKTDWNFAMMVVAKIEDIIERRIEIRHPVTISWYYSPKKTGTFPKGAGGGGGWTVKRTPFEVIFGKFHQIHCYYEDSIKFKLKKNELAKSKIEAVRFAYWFRILKKSEGYDYKRKNRKLPCKYREEFCNGA